MNLENPDLNPTHSLMQISAVTVFLVMTIVKTLIIMIIVRILVVRIHSCTGRIPNIFLIFSNFLSFSFRKFYHQTDRMPPFEKVQEFEDDKPYIELCWEAEQDARFLLGISNDRTSFSMRAEPVIPAGQRVRPPTGSPLRKSYTQNREIKTESIYSQFKNNRATSALDNRASFLPYRPTKKELLSKPSRTEKRLSTAILSKISTGKNKTAASRSKSDSETYRYSQDYNTGTLTRDDDIDHLEDLRLSLLSWTTTTHESFVGSAGMQNETSISPWKAIHRSVSDVSVKRDERDGPKGSTEQCGERKSLSVACSGRSSRLNDMDGIDEEVARIMVCTQLL